MKSIEFIFDLFKVSAFIFLFLVVHTKVNAESVEEQRLKSKSNWNFLNDLTYDSNFQALDAVDNLSGATLTSGIRYKVNSKTNIWGFARLSKRFTGEERFDLLDTIVRVERTFDQKLFGFSQRARVDAILPTNENIHESTSFVGALGGQLRLTRMLPGNIFMTWNNNLRWNFHNFRISEFATPNIQSTASTLFAFAYGITPNIQLGTGLGWALASTYKNVITDNYSIDLNLTYIFNSELTVTGGWTTAGTPFTADGQNSNIRLFDERDSTAYLSLTHFL